jgi:hypothetical protein
MISLLLTFSEVNTEGICTFFAPLFARVFRADLLCASLLLHVFHAVFSRLFFATFFAPIFCTSFAPFF